MHAYICIGMSFTYTHTPTMIYLKIIHDLLIFPSKMHLFCLLFIFPDKNISHPSIIKGHSKCSVNIYWINKFMTMHKHIHTYTQDSDAKYVSFCKLVTKKGRNVPDQNQTLLLRKLVLFKMDLHRPFITTALPPSS